MIRGGDSIFFSGSSYGGFASSMAAQPPFATNVSLTTSTAERQTLQNPFPTVPLQTITNTYAIDKNYKLSYAQTWSFALQQTFSHGLLVELEYIGTKGTGLPITEQPNRATPGASPLNAQQQLQIGNATGFSYLTSQGDSIFHAAQTRITRRFGRGVSAYCCTRSRNPSTTLRVFRAAAARWSSSPRICAWSAACRPSTSGTI